MILSAQPEIEVVGEAESGRQAIDLANRLAPDVILMDVRMPNIDGLEATRRLVELGTTARIVILTTFDLDEYVCAAIRAGASGFLLKDVRPQQLVEAIEVVAAGDALLAPSVTQRLLARFAEALTRPEERASELSLLTERELEVLKLVAAGLSNAELAERLFLSETTVKTHVSSVLRKLSLRDRVQAVVLAYEAGLVRPGATRREEILPEEEAVGPRDRWIPSSLALPSRATSVPERTSMNDFIVETQALTKRFGSRRRSRRCRPAHFLVAPPLATSARTVPARQR